MNSFASVAAACAVGVLLDRLEVIEDPDRAAVRREDHRVVARVQRDLVDAHGRQVRLDAHPALGAIDRDEQPGLGADVEHVRVLQVLGHRLDRPRP